VSCGGYQEEKVQSNRLEKRRTQLLLGAKRELETVREKLRREAVQEREMSRWVADVLCCAMLCCAVLRCAALCCAVLCCAVLRCAAL
jgi:hypothetical protein